MKGLYYGHPSLVIAKDIERAPELHRCTCGSHLDIPIQTELLAIGDQ